MERRRFLGAAALAGLPDLTTGTPNGADDQNDGSTDQPAPVFEPLLVDVHAHAFVERYDEHGSIRVSAHPDSGEIVAAEVVIQSEWGEADAGLTAAEARVLGRELLAAATLTEGRQ